MKQPALTYEAVVVDLIETIEATGGVLCRKGGAILGCAGDPEWYDLADVYLKACAASGRTPLLVEDEDEAEDAEDDEEGEAEA